MPEIDLIPTSSDQEAFALAASYWRGENVKGKWVWSETVASICQRYGLSSSAVLNVIRQHATAYDVSKICDTCREPMQLNSRSDVTSHNRGTPECVHCAEKRSARLRAEQIRRLLEEDAVRQQYIQLLSAKNEVFDFDSITFLNAILTFGLLQFSNENEDGSQDLTFFRLHLCSSNDLSGKVLLRLFTSGIIRVSPDTPDQVVAIDAGEPKLTNLFQVKWCLAADAKGRSIGALYEFLGRVIDRPTDYSDAGESIARLFWTIALDDVRTFFTLELSKYRMQCYRIGEKTEASFRHALSRFSIPQVRGLIRTVVEKVVARASSREYNHALHALNTFQVRSRLTSIEPSVRTGTVITSLKIGKRESQPS